MLVSVVGLRSGFLRVRFEIFFLGAVERRWCGDVFVFR
ncbi:hypothetical protein HMPREF9206_1232 [Cutibacterium acnes J139]|nr:hypothetical protein HMPREF9206_1232 [Cutibacterium acnes J139]